MYTDNRLELLFRHLGLSEKQATLYRLLLENGASRPAALAQKSGIKRSTVYALLKDLAQHGLVKQFEKGNIIFFRPETPYKLHEMIEAKTRDAGIAKELGEDVVAGLTGQWKAAVGRPVVRHFEGREGVVRVLEDIYSPGKKDIVGCVGLEHPDEELYGDIIARFMPLRIRRKIFTRALNSDSPRARALKKQDAKHLREIFLSDPTRYPLPAEIDVYAERIALLSFDRKDFTGLIIENQAFAITIRSVFTLLFDLLHAKENQETDRSPSALSPSGKTTRLGYSRAHPRPTRAADWQRKPAVQTHRVAPSSTG